MEGTLKLMDGLNVARDLIELTSWDYNDISMVLVSSNIT